MTVIAFFEMALAFPSIFAVLTAMPSKLGLAPPPSLLALHSLLLCVGFQICKQKGLAPKPPSWVQTFKCHWCLEAEEKSTPWEETFS